MLYYFLSLFTAAVILLFNNIRSEMNRWAAFFLFSASIGGLSDVLWNAGWSEWSQLLQFMNHTLTPYGVLIFSIVYSERFLNKNIRLLFKWLLLIPIGFMLLMTPFTPKLDINFLVLALWACPYYVASCYLLLFSLWKEQDRRKKRSRLITSIIMVPTLLAVIIFINIGKVISPDFDFFRYISLFIVYSLLVSLLCVFVYGVLGVKLRFERDSFDNTMKAASSGAALFNHTIKNEIGKIAISVENLKFAVPKKDEEAAQHLQIIENASDHLLAMANRIHHQMRTIELREQPTELDVLVNECLAQHYSLFELQNIRVKSQYLCKPVVFCDPVHMKEVIGNILMNAVEAMPDGGLLEARISEMKRGIRLSFHDTGKGISSNQLAHVFEPFYSTKQRSENFGLGLSYIYNVMQKSEGSVKVFSNEDEGTYVALNFPRKKVIAVHREG